jgi:hypothetical protein
VLADEERHVEETRRGVYDLLPRAQAAEVLAVHRAAEARANLAFSSHQLTAFLRVEPARTPRHRRALYRLCALALAGASHVA